MSVVISQLDGELVARTRKVPSLTTDATFAQPHPPWPGQHFTLKPRPPASLMKAEACGLEREDGDIKRVRRQGLWTPLVTGGPLDDPEQV
jgi:hypothetical protein